MRTKGGNKAKNCTFFRTSWDINREAAVFQCSWWWTVYQWVQVTVEDLTCLNQFAPRWATQAASDDVNITSATCHGALHGAELMPIDAEPLVWGGLSQIYSKKRFQQQKPVLLVITHTYTSLIKARWMGEELTHCDENQRLSLTEQI